MAGCAGDPDGIRTTLEFLGKTGVLQSGEAKAEAIFDGIWASREPEASLRLLMAIWPNLDSETKHRILTIATSKGKNTAGL